MKLRCGSRWARSGAVYYVCNISLYILFSLDERRSPMAPHKESVKDYLTRSYGNGYGTVSALRKPYPWGQDSK